jgi:glycosyltransferase involved in cell wall biosynthesis
MTKITVLFLGRKGGGARFTIDCAEKLLAMGSLEKIVLNERNEFTHLAKRIFGDRLVLVPLGHPLTQIFRFLKPGNRRTLIEQTTGQCLFIPMSSITDVFHYSNFSLAKKVIRVIHDTKSHPGEVWPLNFFIDLSIKRTDIAISLNNKSTMYIREKYQKKVVIQLPLPAPNFSHNPTRESFQFDLLLLGRMKKYKGLELFTKALSELDFSNKKIIVAGEGMIKSSTKKALLSSGVEIRNYWLEEDEIYNLLSSARVVVLPYLEASQSGILAWCLENSKRTVLSSNPELVSQASSAITQNLAFVAEANTPKALANAIYYSLQHSSINLIRTKKSSILDTFVDRIKELYN